MEKNVDLGIVNQVEKEKHIASTIQADTLFYFCEKLDYLEIPIKNRLISARYCEENIEYLKIPNIKRIAYPMKCFCDINMHRLAKHLAGYGSYGIALKKEWGMKNKIQPVQYINPASTLIEDFSKAFSNALKIDKKSQTDNEKMMKSYLLHQMMYFKPYSGMAKNKKTGEEEEKCFTDECEWRFVPNVSCLGYSQVYYDETILKDGDLREISNSLQGKPEASLKFDYEDLKYIIIKSEDDLKKIMKIINEIKITQEEKNLLISKIIIWELSGGDF